MSARQQLQLYLAQVHRRMRLRVGVRSAAALAAAALAATLVLVAVTNHYAFSTSSLWSARLVLAAALLATLIYGWLGLRHLTHARAVALAERAHPEFEQRLATFRGADPEHPFLELLAADTLEHAAAPEHFVPRRHLALWAATGSLCAAALLATFFAPGYWGYGAKLLWTGPRAHAAPLYSLAVKPGNALLRRHGDQLVTALPRGLTPADGAVHLFARFQSATSWEKADMRPAPGAGGFQYLFAGLPEDVDYYVQVGALRSPVYHLRVRDLPLVKQIAATYHYPAWTGVKDETNPHAGDLRAVAGTRAELTIVTDQPLQSGRLLLDDGQSLPLTSTGRNTYHASLLMQKDGVYHVAAQVPGEDPDQPTRLSEDYFIAAPPAAPPQVALVRPNRDYRASPIEEVTVTAQASDQFGLKNLDLHYSVNGGPDTTVPLLGHPGAKDASGQTVLSLEDFKAQPGDLISVYASARDGNTEARSDMLFIQADPFEREFSQSQQSGGGGGGGGGGNQSAQIADREKEIIAATFKQQGDKHPTPELAADTAKLLSQSQTTLHDQATSLSGRMDARELTDENQAFSEFQQDMTAAAAAMAPAAQSLQGEKWPAAIPNEEKALRFLLRADATFRQIQVAFGARGGGGGGGGGAARDLASLFDLELDTQKNQYETQQQASSSEQKAQAIDDTLKKLDDLAQRQQQLAQSQNQAPSTAQQRWQQDLLRREAEQLQQQLQQMANQNAQSASAAQSGQSSAQSSGQQSGQTARSGSQSSSQSGSQSGSQSAAQGSSSATAQQQAAQTAANRLRQAADAMQRGGAANALQAEQALREARAALSALQQQDAGGRLGSMASQADQLARAQKQQADQVRGMIADKKTASQQALDQLVANRQQTSDQFEQLEQSVRNAARDLNSTQPGASSKLRSALDGADSSDLATRLQRSADWLRNGNFSDSSESSLTSDLQQMSQKLRQAQQALGGAQGATQSAQLSAAMDQIERLRQQLSGEAAGNKRQGGQPNQAGPAGQQYQAGQLARNGQPGQSGQPGQPGQPGQSGQSGGQQGGGQQGGGQAGQQSATGAGNGNGQRGGVGNRLAGGNAAQQGYRDGQIGNARAGAGDRYGNGGYDLGNTHIVGQAVAPQAGPNPADTQREIQQDLDALNHLRQTLPPDADTQRAMQQLIDQTKNLDPSRFPGNPQMVAEMHQELLHSVDSLELQIRQKLDATQGGTIRGQAPPPAPAGYEDAVAAYFRHLSGGH